MDALSERVTARLATASIAGDVVKGLSQYLQHHGDNISTAQAVAAGWAAAIAAAPPERLLPLLYVANDVLQGSRGERKVLFAEAFAHQLPAAFATAVKGNRRERAAISRLPGIWRERGVYSPRFCGVLSKAIDDALAEEEDEGSPSAVEYEDNNGPSGDSDTANSSGRSPQQQSASSMSSRSSVDDLDGFGFGEGVAAPSKSLSSSASSSAKAVSPSPQQQSQPAVSLPQAIAEAQRLHKLISAVRQMLTLHPLRRELASGETTIPPPSQLTEEQRSALHTDAESAEKLARLYLALTRLVHKKRPALIAAINHALEAGRGKLTSLELSVSGMSDAVSMLQGLVAAAEQQGHVIRTMVTADEATSPVASTPLAHVSSSSSADASSGRVRSAKPDLLGSLLSGGDDIEGLYAASAADSSSPGLPSYISSVSSSSSSNGEATGFGASFGFSSSSSSALKEAGGYEQLDGAYGGGEQSGGVREAPQEEEQEEEELDPLMADDWALLGLVGSSTAASAAVAMVPPSMQPSFASGLPSASSGQLAGIKRPRPSEWGQAAAAAASGTPSSPGDAGAALSGTSPYGAVGGGRGKAARTGTGTPSPAPADGSPSALSPAAAGGAAAAGSSGSAGGSYSAARLLHMAGVTAAPSTASSSREENPLFIGQLGSGKVAASSVDDDVDRLFGSDASVTAAGAAGAGDGGSPDGDDEDEAEEEGATAGNKPLFSFDADNAFSGKHWDPVRGVWVEEEKEAAPSEEAWREH